MRGFKSTLALLVVLIGLGAYAYFYASKAEDSSAAVDKLFPGIASDNIEELTVKNDTGEVTSLKKVDGKWMYAEGSLAGTTVVRASRKVGRNDPCPCGSGKKYKQCCGR